MKYCYVCCSGTILLFRSICCCKIGFIQECGCYMSTRKQFGGGSLAREESYSHILSPNRKSTRNNNKVINQEVWSKCLNASFRSTFLNSQEGLATDTSYCNDFCGNHCSEWRRLEKRTSNRAQTQDIPLSQSFSHKLLVPVTNLDISYCSLCGLHLWTPKLHFHSL